MSAAIRRNAILIFLLSLFVYLGTVDGKTKLLHEEGIQIELAHNILHRGAFVDNDGNPVKEGLGHALAILPFYWMDPNVARF